jgi:hypothetical protein
METTILLSKADFADYADLPESLDMDRLRPHILAAQRQRLRPVLTDVLTTELLRLVEAERAAASTSTSARLIGAWQALRVKAVAIVACAALARYMPFAQATATSNGIRLKGSQYSEAVDGRDLARMATIYDGEALSYEAELRAWLLTNGQDFGEFYPVATACCGPADAGRTPSVVVQSIRRPEDVPTVRRPAAARETYPVPTPGPTPPANYGKTLSPYLTQAEGIVADFASSQMLRLNVLAGVSGGNLTLQLLDSSDGNSVSAFDYAAGYAGTYYLFVKKDGSSYEAQWPAVDTAISV